MTEMTHHFAGQTRCSNCRTWGLTMPYSYTMMSPKGGKHVRNFCKKSCLLGWCFRQKIVPMELLPRDIVDGMRKELLEATA